MGALGCSRVTLAPSHASRSVLECCVMLILMYGSENWIVTKGLIDKLEAFQREPLKRVLKWPKYHSNTAAITALEMPLLPWRCQP